MKDAEVVFLLGFAALGIVGAVVAVWEPSFWVVVAVAVCAAAVTID